MFPFHDATLLLLWSLVVLSASCPALIRSAPLSAVQSHARRAASTQQAPSSSSSSRPPAFPSQAEKERAKEEEEEDEEDEEDEKESQRQVQPFTWGSVAFMTLVGGGSLVYFLYEQDKQLNTIRTESIGTPLIGGPWSLIDDKGEVRRRHQERRGVHEESELVPI